MNKMLNCLNIISKAEKTLKFLKLTQTLIVISSIAFIIINVLSVVKEKN